MAAFLNSLYGHGAELDDGCRMAMGHVGVHVIPAVLALAEAEEKTQDEIMVAIAVGYETYIRISAAAQPGMIKRSFHSTGMAGGIACAASCAKLLGLDAEGIEDAMSLASTMSSGLLTYSESRQMIKPINPARAAETGVFAARLAQSGIKGPLNFLEGPNGWFHAVADSVNKQMISKEFGHLLIHDCYFKLYPSCRHTHCGIEAASNIHKKVNPDEINKVYLYLYPNAIKLAGQIKFPVEPDETKFSIHYSCAIALLYGEYGVDYMNPPLVNNAIRDMINKIELISDEEMEDREKGIRGTKIEVIMKDGKKVNDIVIVPKGDPENPLNDKDLWMKLKLCAKDIVSENIVEKLVIYISEFGGSKLLDSRTLYGSRTQ
ncbi:MmgE/PrpD family protein [Acetatifactor muris]|uniref:2-methylcitrate dehydratase n=1 Tax=Acetatifactor muris TaxID=879566 RepID=A0A2K4ZCH0_9FIRM|nr:MmgE/PrpD family protein [Acetatifactor muris]MCR2046570.1 MmgE/PrpD family protein [Acetatifactor muris]SOY28159.1 2-methylcitrate dehydratase [Acetatifactor muris]